MAISPIPLGHAIDMLPFGARLAQEKTQLLFKSADLEVIRLVLRSGKCLAPHQIPGCVTLHCLEGQLQVLIGDECHALRASQLMHLPAHVPHAVCAVEDASALVSIVLHNPAPTAAAH